MQRFLSRHAFTLIEMITVIAIIAILAGLVLSLTGLVQGKGNRAKAETEIRAVSGALESYKTDAGGYPQDGDTDTLDPRTMFSPTTNDYKEASLALYKALSGDENANGTFETAETAKQYLPDFFKTSRLGGVKDASGNMTSVTFIKDPFGNSYGYSTAGLKAEQEFRVALATNPSATRPATLTGYNPTFDLWSTGGSTGGTERDLAKWVKNWTN